ncbi:MAG: LacI family DNA-binding transcriptional regulator [Microbacterium sp.]
MSPRRRALTDRPRIKDVALASGVSAQTVSNVLNNRPGFTDETRDRVLKAVADIGYVRDPAGRQLRTGESRRFAFSMTQEDLDPRNPFAMTFLKSIVSAAEELDRRVIILDHEAEADGSFAADLIGGEADGFIFINSSPGDYRVRLLEEQGVPFALMGRTLPGQSQSWIDIDNAAAIGTAVDHVVTRGFRRLAFAGFDSDREWLQDRRHGFVESAARHGIPVEEDFIVEASSADLESRLRHLLRRPDRPTAIVTASDSIGVTAVNIAHSEGLDVGRDLAVTGFDGGVLASLVIPALTTVGIPVHEIAQRLMRRLADEVENGRSKRPGEIIETQLILGGSA